MGVSAASVIPLLSKWEEYLGTCSDGNLNGFARWLLEDEPNAHPEPESMHNVHPDPEAMPTAPDKEHHAPFLLTRLYRSWQTRSKPIAKEIGLTNALELDMLIHIAIMKNPNKKQLCQEMGIEGSTGVEITKRLVAKGFLAEKIDAKDRRAARLSLTVKGQRTVVDGYSQLGPIHSDLLNSLRISSLH